MENAAGHFADRLITAVRAKRTLPIHDHLVIDAYGGLLRGTLQAVAEPFGVELSSFDAPVEVGAASS